MLFSRFHLQFVHIATLFLGFRGRSFVLVPLSGQGVKLYNFFLVLHAERRIVHIVLHKRSHTWQRLHDQSLDVAIPHHRNIHEYVKSF